jgi:AraC-like DNA-binding protein
MDVLSDVVTTMRSGRPHSSMRQRPPSFVLSLDAVGGAGFHVVRRGSCVLHPAVGAPIELAAGDVAFFPRGSAHRLVGGSAELLCGGYLTDRSHPLMADLPAVVHLPAPRREAGLDAAVALLGAELSRPRPGRAGMVPALLDVVLVQILRAASAAKGWGAAVSDPAVAAALRAMHGDPRRPWTVASLAACGSLSRAAFARRFARLVGRPPLAYLTWWRMTLAARMLREGDAPAAAVAREVGYASPFAFAHAFKREYGRPPGAYRHESA